MTNEEKNIIFDVVKTKLICRRAFKDADDEDAVSRYDAEITGVLCVISKLGLWDDYFNFIEGGDKKCSI